MRVRNVVVDDLFDKKLMLTNIFLRKVKKYQIETGEKTRLKSLLRKQDPVKVQEEIAMLRRMETELDPFILRKVADMVPVDIRKKMCHETYRQKYHLTMDKMRFLETMMGIFSENEEFYMTRQEEIVATKLMDALQTEAQYYFEKFS